MVAAPAILAAYGLSRPQSRQARQTRDNEGLGFCPQPQRPQTCQVHKAPEGAGAGHGQQGRGRPNSAPPGALSTDEIRFLLHGSHLHNARATERSLVQSTLPPLADVTNTSGSQLAGENASDRQDRGGPSKRTCCLKACGNRVAGECQSRVRCVSSASLIAQLQQKTQIVRRVETPSAADQRKARLRKGLSYAASSPRKERPRRAPAFSGVTFAKTTTPAIVASPSQHLAELKRRRVRDKEALLLRTDEDLHEDAVYFTDYAMRLRARKMWHRELKAAKEAQLSASAATTPSTASSEGFCVSKGKEHTEKKEVADAVERLLGRMRGLGESCECVKDLATKGGLAPKKAPALSGKVSNHDSGDYCTVQVRNLKGQLKDSLFDVIREQEVQVDIAKKMAQAFKSLNINDCAMMQ